MGKQDLLGKVMEFAENGRGRRLLNTLNRRELVLTSFELDEVLRVYCELGLPKEVEMLKKRRGILGEDQYNALAEAVRKNGCAAQYENFAVALGKLLHSGMEMNPTKMKEED